MSEFKQAFCWWSFVDRGYSPEQLLRHAAETGYVGVDLIGAEHWPLVRQYGLSLAAIAGHASLIDGLNRPENAARIERELVNQIALAEKWKVACLICFSGNRGNVSDPDGLEQSAETLRRVSPVAERAGVTLVVELLNSRIDHPDYQCDRTSWGVELCRKVDSPAVRLLYDIYHMQIMEGDLIRTIQTHHPFFAHYHTAGNPGRHQIGDDQEINYPAVFRAIRATHYQGFIAHEFIPLGDPLVELTEAFRRTVNS